MAENCEFFHQMLFRGGLYRLNVMVSLCHHYCCGSGHLFDRVWCLLSARQLFLSGVSSFSNNLTGNWYFSFTENYNHLQMSNYTTFFDNLFRFYKMIPVFAWTHYLAMHEKSGEPGSRQTIWKHPHNLHTVFEGFRNLLTFHCHISTFTLGSKRGPWILFF